jgi:hypothetical protein
MMQFKWGILQRPLGCTLANMMLWMVHDIARYTTTASMRDWRSHKPALKFPMTIYLATFLQFPMMQTVNLLSCLDAAFDNILDGHSFRKESTTGKRIKKMFRLFVVCYITCTRCSSDIVAKTSFGIPVMPLVKELLTSIINCVSNCLILMAKLWSNGSLRGSSVISMNLLPKSR